MNNLGQQMDQEETGTSSSSSPASNGNSELSPRLRDKLLSNEMRSIRNRGFHDGYDEGKQATIQKSFDSGYEKAFEQNFILSTLKGVANALKSSYNLRQQNDQNNDNHRHQNQRPSSANYSSTMRNSRNQRSTPSSMAQTPSSSSTESTASSSPKSTSLLSTSISTSPSPISCSSSSKSKNHHHRHSTGHSSSRLLTQKYHSSNGRRSATSTMSSTSSGVSNDNHGCGADYETKRLSSISSGNVSNCGNFSSNNVVNINISSNHLSLLESMKFDGTSDIESLKNDLIRICRENRLEILAHYVSQIG